MSKYCIKITDTESSIEGDIQISMIGDICGTLTAAIRAFSKAYGFQISDLESMAFFFFFSILQNETKGNQNGEKES